MHIFSQTEYFWINRGVVSEIVDVRKLTEHNERPAG